MNRPVRLCCRLHQWPLFTLRSGNLRTCGIACAASACSETTKSQVGLDQVIRCAPHQCRPCRFERFAPRNFGQSRTGPKVPIPEQTSPPRQLRDSFLEGWSEAPCRHLPQLVGVARFELTTPASRRQCSTRLSYTPTEGGITLLRVTLQGPRGPAARARSEPGAWRRYSERWPCLGGFECAGPACFPSDRPGFPGSRHRGRKR